MLHYNCLRWKIIFDLIVNGHTSDYYCFQCFFCVCSRELVLTFRLEKFISETHSTRNNEKYLQHETMSKSSNIDLYDLSSLMAKSQAARQNKIKKDAGRIAFDLDIGII